MARRSPSRPGAPAICPVCGAAVHRNALACRECGADHLSGWREDADHEDGLDLPDEDFDHDDFVRREFGGFSRPAGIKPFWWLVAVALVVISVLTLLMGRR